jgi:hypothetical protein
MVSQQTHPFSSLQAEGEAIYRQAVCLRLDRFVGSAASH